MRIATCLFAGLAATIFSSHAMAAYCVARLAPDDAIHVDGVVAGGRLNGPSPTGNCMPDPQWAGRAAPALTAPTSATTTVRSQVLLAATAQSPSSTLEKFFVGVHVENDVGFDSNDLLTMYFDANNNKAFDGADFAISVELGPVIEPLGQEDCNVRTEAVHYYTYEGGWHEAEGVDVSNAILVETSYDFNPLPPSDPESEIWEAEVSIDLGALGKQIDATTGLGFGSKLFIDTPGIPAEQRVYLPASMTTVSDAADDTFHPDSGNIDASELEALIAKDCKGDIIIASVDSSSPSGQVGSFKRMSPFTGVLDDNDTNELTATLRLYNLDLPADTSAVTGANGHLLMQLKPYNADPNHSGFVDTINAIDRSLTLNSFGETMVTEHWPKNYQQYSQHAGAFASTEHVCYIVTVSGFPHDVNINVSNDSKQKNLAYVTASTITETLVVNPPQGEEHSGEGVYYVRAHWANLPTYLIGDAGTKPRPDMWSYRFSNYSGLTGSGGIEDIGNGWYRFQLGEKRAEIEVTINGGKMPMEVQHIRVDPTDGGSLYGKGTDPKEIRTTPGKAITIIASGRVGVEHSFYKGRLNSANGFEDQDPAGNQEFLLSSAGYVPSQQVGALIGSFDGFTKSSFRIGATSTFIVPPGVTSVWVAVNDTRQDYGDNWGDGFDLSVTQADPVSYPTRLGLAGFPDQGIPDNIEAGGNLPQLILDVYQADEDRGQAMAYGNAAWAITESHRR